MPGIEALRGVAAVTVALFHLWALTSAPRFPGYEIVVGWGVWAVDLFFLLSGFLLVQYFWEQPRRHSLRQYYVRRFFRIAPAYYVCIALLFLFFANQDLLWSEAGRTQVIANATFTQWLSPTTSTSLNVSGVFWTLSIEMFLYALLPLFAWLIVRRPLLWGGALFAIGSAYRLYVALDGEALQRFMFKALPEAPEGIMRIYLLRQFVGILPLFVIGMMLRWWLHYRPGASGVRTLSRFHAPLLLLLLVPSTAILFPVEKATDHRYWGLFAGWDLAICLLLMPALAYAATRVLGRLSMFMKGLVWLGKWSYGIYLWHFPAILWAFDRGPMVRPADMSHAGTRVAVALTLSVVLGAVSYHLVERPSRKLGRTIAASLAGP